MFYAKFSPGDVKKSIYGDAVSSPEGWKAKINVGVEGNVFELVENATFDREHCNIKLPPVFIQHALSHHTPLGVKNIHSLASRSVQNNSL